MQISKETPRAIILTEGLQESSTEKETQVIEMQMVILYT